MKIIPLFKCRDMARAIDHYTKVLDFKFRYPDESQADSVVSLTNGDAGLQLTLHESENLFGSVANIWVDDVDDLFKKYLSRGLDNTGRPESPVHQGPVDQSWGTREFYVTDEDGNTLRFCQAVK
jgi:catechol 2,3-dioxygenase-like lactoylglutathione lyase family enzyme